MNTVSTITTRGQVVIPISIRQMLALKPADKLLFEVEDNKIIARPVISIDQAMGMVKTAKKVSKKEYKEAIVAAVVEKYKK